MITKIAEVVISVVAKGQGTLAVQVGKYKTAPVDFTEVSSVLDNIQKDRTIAIVKEGRTESLQIPALPQCFAYDAFSTEPPSTEILVNTLIQHPNAAVSIQLIPTIFSADETSLIDSTCQALGMLVRGVQNPGWGNVVFESAQQEYNTYS